MLNNSKVSPKQKNLRRRYSSRSGSARRERRPIIPELVQIENYNVEDPIEKEQSKWRRQKREDLLFNRARRKMFERKLASKSKVISHY